MFQARGFSLSLGRRHFLKQISTWQIAQNFSYNGAYLCAISHIDF
uniref:Uncharacterized protein n=1 Tax=Siphoviridae sp. ctTnV63 TaxID=2825523 RepID=A0A8S5NW53_9CAUD|nr:MAG TPA: hypothetical protein [Siphoviridae sp. ctTnV63]